MKRILTSLTIFATIPVMADTPAVSLTQSAAAVQQLETGPIVIDIDDGKRLVEELAAKQADAPVTPDNVTAPQAVTTRVIELDPPPVVVVNRTRQFRIVARDDQPKEAAPESKSETEQDSTQ